MQKKRADRNLSSLSAFSSDQKLILLYDLAVNFALAVGSIGLIGIDVNNSCIVGAYTNYYITKDQVSLLSVNLQAYNFAVGYAQLSSILGSGVDMTHGNDHALSQLHFAAGTYQLASSRTFQHTGLTDRSINTDGTGIGHGQLYLGLLSGGAQNQYSCQSLLGAYNINSLFTGELTGLREVLLLMQNGICTEQYLQVLILSLIHI